MKQLRRMDTPLKQDAEIALYLKQFDEAESLYRRMDRPDLAIDMRMRLGDWFAVSFTLLHQLCSLLLLRLLQMQITFCLQSQLHHYLCNWTAASMHTACACDILDLITTISSPLFLDHCFRAHCMCILYAWFSQKKSGNKVLCCTGSSLTQLHGLLV